MTSKRKWNVLLPIAMSACVLSGLIGSDLYAEVTTKRVQLFDGATFNGWEGDTAITWRIENGAITGGSLERAAPRNEFLTTARTFENFDLRLRFKVDGRENVNAGIQFRTARIPNHFEVSGYQADIGPEVDGHLYDESRRKKMLAAPEVATVRRALEAAPADGWQTYRILAQGNHIQLWLNGVQTVDFVEQDAAIARSGVIAVQIHGGMIGTVAYKDIEIIELPSRDTKSITSSDHRPNFIIILIDDMGYAGLSCFGNPYFKTPEIDRMAAEGMRLTDFHSSGTVCSPTRAGLLTGRYQQRAAIEAVIHPDENHPEHRKGLQLSEVTFAEMLRDADYVTGLVGKWHLGFTEISSDFHPQNHGFDEFIGYHSGNIDYISHVGDHNRHDWWHGRTESAETGYTTQLVNRHAVDFIREHGKSGHPFCLFVAHEAIHNPVQVLGDAVRRTTEHWNRWKWNEAADDERIAKYRGMTLPIDEGVGQLRRVLDEMSIANQTFIFLFSDNGPSRDFPSGDPQLRGWKGDVYEGGHKVPAIAWWPGRIAAGTESDEPLISIDIMPTLLSLAGVDLPARPLDGTVISDVLLNQRELNARPLYWASLGNNGGRAEAMREKQWKIVVQHPRARPGSFENETIELYNLRIDPSESMDVADSHPQLSGQMKERLAAWYREVRATATKQPGGWPEL